MGLDRSSYYDIKFRKPHDGEIRRLLLADAIADIHRRSRGTYGRLRIRAALRVCRIGTNFKWADCVLFPASRHQRIASAGRAQI